MCSILAPKHISEQGQAGRFQGARIPTSEHLEDVGPRPVPVDQSLGAREPVLEGVGADHGLVLRGNGRVVEWGNPVHMKEKTESLRDIIAINAGHRSKYALDRFGRVINIGCSNGEAPKEIQGRVIGISRDIGAMFALLDDGRIAGWGDLGKKWSNFPENISDVIELTPQMTWARKEGGTLFTWGDGSI